MVRSYESANSPAISQLMPSGTPIKISLRRPLLQRSACHSRKAHHPVARFETVATLAQFDHLAGSLEARRKGQWCSNWYLPSDIKGPKINAAGVDLNANFRQVSASAGNISQGQGIDPIER